MAADPHHPRDVEARFWKELPRGRTVMLGVIGDRQPFQPMTAFAEAEDGVIWFFTRRDTDLARAVAAGADAMMVVQAKDEELHASVVGRLAPDHDRERIDRYWSPVVAAWYPDGKDDPMLTLLRFDATEAQVWLSTAGPVKFGWEIAKANLTGRTPDLGGRASLELGSRH